jgi:F0F1-type ATP synthase membrane subunit b/b'
MQIADALIARSEGVLTAGMVDIDLSLFFMLGLFVVFAVLMHYLVFKPLIAAQEARHRGMGGAMVDASNHELRAAELKNAYESRLHKARQDAVVIRDTLKRDATATAQSKLGTVQDESNKGFETAKAELAQFAEKARVEMKSHADALSTELSARLLGEKAR